jgi:8-oxo-dGTP pyrophosphatase MutT (NUDIX family)
MTGSVCDNTSVGVIIRDGAGRVLLIRRARPPIGLAPVAGHIDGHGDAPAAARAEVAEEIGLRVTSLSPRIHRWRPNRCRRRTGPQGAGHLWTVFDAAATGTLRPDPAEAGAADWYTRGDVQRLAERTAAAARGALGGQGFAADPGLEPVWVAFLAEFGLVRLGEDDLAAAGRLSQVPAGPG